MSKRYRNLAAVLLALVLVLSLSVTGCTKAPATAPAESEKNTGGTMSLYIAEPAYIDPWNGQESEGIQVISAVYDSLVDFDPITSKILPAAAESWESNADATVWTFKLRAGAKFHDGTPVTAADFKYGWERIVKKKSDMDYHLVPVKGFDELRSGTATELVGVVAKDDTTLEVTLSEPMADFQYVVGHPTLAPVPKAAVEKDEKAFSDMPIGNGPFKMAEPWKHQQYIKVVRFDDYYGEKALLDGAEYKIFKDDETAYNEFQAGNLDFCSIPTGQIKATVEKYGESADGYTVSKGKQALLGSELSTYYVWLNVTDPALKNVDVRRALSLAVNRQAICDIVYEGTRIPASGPVPAGIVGFQKDAWPYNKYDVAQAEELLAKAGYPKGQGLPEITLSFNAGRGHEKVMQLIQGDLTKIGVKVKLDGRPWETYTSEFLKTQDGKYTAAGAHQMMRLGWQADYPIMDNFLYPMFQSTAGDNKALYVNAEVDKMLADARKTTDDEQRVKMYQDIEKKIGEDQPLIAVVNYRHIRVGSDRIRDFVFSSVGIPTLEKAWIETAK